MDREEDLCSVAAAALEAPPEQVKNPPSVAIVTMQLILPVLLILAQGRRRRTRCCAAGTSVSALPATLLASMISLGSAPGLNRDQMTALLLIMGAGGALKQIIIVDTGTGATGKMPAGAHISPLVVAFLMAMPLRFGEVSIITAAGIMAPS